MKGAGRLILAAENNMSILSNLHNIDQTWQDLTNAMESGESWPLATI